MQSYNWLIGALTALAAATATLAAPTQTQTQQLQPSATQLALDMYHGCLKDLSISCVRPKALQWFNAALQQPEVRLTERLSLVRLSESDSEPSRRSSGRSAEQQLFDGIDNYLASHALRIQAPEYFRSSEARALVPDFLLDNPLTQGGLVPLAAANEGE